MLTPDKKLPIPSKPIPLTMPLALIYCTLIFCVTQLILTGQQSYQFKKLNGNNYVIFNPNSGQVHSE